MTNATMARLALLLGAFAATVGSNELCEDVEVSQFLQRSVESKSTSWKEFQQAVAKRTVHEGESPLPNREAQMGINAAMETLKAEAAHLHKVAQRTHLQLQGMVEFAPKDKADVVFEQALTPLDNFFESVGKELERSVPSAEMVMHETGLANAKKAHVEFVSELKAELGSLWNTCTSLGKGMEKDAFADCAEQSKDFEAAYPQLKMQFFQALEDDLMARVESKEELQKFINTKKPELVKILETMGTEVRKVLTQAMGGLQGLGPPRAELLIQTDAQTKAAVRKHSSDGEGCDGIIDKMGRGINIGNVYDFDQGDRNPEVVKKQVKWAKDTGFAHVRIPVTWGEYFDAESELTKQVTEVVDYALGLGLYVVINTHHEDWLKSAYDIGNTPLKDKFWALWLGIAGHFASRSNKLIFEILNEPDKNFGDWNADPLDAYDQTAIDRTRDVNGMGYAAVRSVAGNEARMIFVHPNAKSSKGTAMTVYPNIWSLPGGGNDACVGVTIHTYDPYDFCGENGENIWTNFGAMKKDLLDQYKQISDWTFDTHIPVYVGEFGVGRQDSRQYQRDTDLVREYYKFTSNHLRAIGTSIAAWDDPGWFKIYAAQEYNIHTQIVGNY